MRKGLSVLGAGVVSVAIVFGAEQGSTTPPMDAHLKSLQGYWEGEGAGGKCFITITNNILHYRTARDWFKTAFTLPDNTSPRELRATIKNSSEGARSAGEVVHAIFKVEGDTLTIATIDPNEVPRKDFATAQDRYIVKKTAPPKDHQIAECKPAARATAGEPNFVDSLFKFPVTPAPAAPGAK